MCKRALPGGSIAPEKVNDKSSLVSIDSRRSEQRHEVTDFDVSSNALNGHESTPKDETSVLNLANLRERVKEGLEEDELLVGMFMGYGDKFDEDETDDWEAFIEQLTQSDLENLKRILDLGEPYDDDDPVDKLQFFRNLP